MDLDTPLMKFLASFRDDLSKRDKSSSTHLENDLVSSTSSNSTPAKVIGLEQNDNLIKKKIESSNSNKANTKIIYVCKMNNTRKDTNKQNLRQYSNIAKKDHEDKASQHNTIENESKVLTNKDENYIVIDEISSSSDEDMNLREEKTINTTQNKSEKGFNNTVQNQNSSINTSIVNSIVNGNINEETINGQKNENGKNIIDEEKQIGIKSKSSNYRNSKNIYNEADIFSNLHIKACKVIVENISKQNIENQNLEPSKIENGIQKKCTTPNESISLSSNKVLTNETLPSDIIALNDFENGCYGTNTALKNAISSPHTSPLSTTKRKSSEICDDGSGKIYVTSKESPEDNLKIRTKNLSIEEMQELSNAEEETVLVGTSIDTIQKLDFKNIFQQSTSTDGFSKLDCKNNFQQSTTIDGFQRLDFKNIFNSSNNKSPETYSSPKPNENGQDKNQETIPHTNNNSNIVSDIKMWYEDNLSRMNDKSAFSNTVITLSDDSSSSLPSSSPIQIFKTNQIEPEQNNVNSTILINTINNSNKIYKTVALKRGGYKDIVFTYTDNSEDISGCDTCKNNEDNLTNLHDDDTSNQNCISNQNDASNQNDTSSRNDVINGPSNQTNVSCKTCNATFASKISLEIHFLKHTNGIKNICESCKNIYTSDLGNVKWVFEYDRILVCYKCKEETIQGIKSKTNILLSDPFKCCCCLERFASFDKFQLHMNEHKQKYECEKCTMLKVLKK